MTDVLYRALARELNGSRETVGAHDSLEGVEHIDKIIEIDQSPIGRTPRSNPATYTGLFGPIRELFAGVPEARVRGYQPGRFSFNVKGGRCENCKGDGILKIEMQFLPDVYVTVRGLQGQALQPRGARDPLQGPLDRRRPRDDDRRGDRVLRGRAERRAPSSRRCIDVGLGYVHLGQPATTLSGGEAQRVKLATELSRRATGRTLYVLDEPTTGLHFADVEKLLEVLHRLVDGGNTVLVIEHNLDVIKTADWIVDLGPGGRRTRRPDHRRGHARAGRRDAGLGDRRVPRPGPPRRAARAAVATSRSPRRPAGRSAATARTARPAVRIAPSRKRAAAARPAARTASPTGGIARVAEERHPLR